MRGKREKAKGKREKAKGVLRKWIMRFLLRSE
jgi:hypothetical protein